jgi:hypothetical protein
VGYIDPRLAVPVMLGAVGISLAAALVLTGATWYCDPARN